MNQKNKLPYWLGEERVDAADRIAGEDFDLELVTRTIERTPDGLIKHVEVWRPVKK